MQTTLSDYADLGASKAAWPAGRVGKGRGRLKGKLVWLSSMGGLMTKAYPKPLTAYQIRS